MPARGIIILFFWAGLLYRFKQQSIGCDSLSLWAFKSRVAACQLGLLPLHFDVSWNFRFLSAPRVDWMDMQRMLGPGRERGGYMDEDVSRD